MIERYCSKCLNKCSIYSSNKFPNPIKSIGLMWSSLLHPSQEKILSNCCRADIIGVKEAMIRELKEDD